MTARDGMISPLAARVIVDTATPASSAKREALQPSCFRKSDKFMPALLRNAQRGVNRHFAYHAMAGAIAACELERMRIRLKEFRDRLGLTLEQMAERSTFSVSQLSRWENGANNIPSGTLPAIAAAYKCRIGEIFDDGELEVLPRGPQLFIKGSVQAGHFIDTWELAEDEWERYTGRSDIAVSPRQRFGLRVVGESMNEIYPPGTVLDCVEYDGSEPIPNGKRVIVQRKRIGDGLESTVKEYFCDENGIEWLVPRSRHPQFQTPFRCDQPGDDIEEIRIIAYVVASIQPE